MSAKPFRAPWEFEVKPFQIVEHVYYVGNKNVSAHLFDTGDGLLLLDTTYGETAYLLLESIRELGFDPHDIRCIVHTHCHIDHFGATRYLVEKYGSETYLSKADMPLMTDAVMNWCTEIDLKYEPPYDYYFDVDVEMCHGDMYRFGNIVMRVYRAPGHTPGTMAFVFELPNGLRVGMHGGIGFNTLSSKYAKEHTLGTAWRDAFGQTLLSLRELEVDVVLGNHPDQNQTFSKQAAMTATHNPFIEAGGWQRFLDRVHAEFNEMVKNDPL